VSRDRRRSKPPQPRVSGRIIARILASRLVRLAPSFPRAWRGQYRSQNGPWSRRSYEELGQPGEAITRFPVEEANIAAADPLRDFMVVNRPLWSFHLSFLAQTFMPFAGSIARNARREARLIRKYKDPLRPTPASGVNLTRDVEAWSQEIGICAIGVGAYDEKFTFADYETSTWYDRIIVCVLEIDLELFQTIPSTGSERAAYAAYEALSEMTSQLAERIRSAGFHAEAHNNGAFGQAMIIHYAVQAGLGQLGLNGQLLTPEAGSRCRMMLITTDAPLDLDAPRDYGIEDICDSCQICVSRCPVGAIPRGRNVYRGVLKSKLNTKRCFPIVTLAEGCGICAKVCPIQRYGLRAVKTHFEQTGTILGKGTDELEGYVWPLDHRFYGPGLRPPDARELALHPRLQARLRPDEPETSDAQPDHKPAS
jgi:epoxyqueuosine reductase